MIDEKLTDEIMAEWFDIVDEVVDEMMKPLVDLDNPEKIMGKKYDDWTEQDLQRAATVYQSQPDILNKFIAKKEIPKLYELEKEVG